MLLDELNCIDNNLEFCAQIEYDESRCREIQFYSQCRKSCNLCSPGAQLSIF